MAPIKLGILQRHLQRIYELETPHDVDDFLVTDASLAYRLEQRQNAQTTAKEKLLVLQEGDKLNVSLYLESTVVDRLAADDPLSQLHDGNFADFLLALEGVSHFLYLTWNASFKRSVSLLELELQAEVDKYVLVLLLLGRQRSGRVPMGLHRQLFEMFTFDTTLDSLQLARYRAANRFAGKYCRALENRYLKSDSAAPMAAELRRFYRLTQNQKIRRIELVN